jgi:hypothetical protein
MHQVKITISEKMPKFTAISDALGNVLEKNDILVVDSGGKDILDKYVGLIELYQLPHVAMVDHDYISDNKKRKRTKDFIVLPKRLEDELAQLGPECNANISNSIDAVDAYEIVLNKMNTDREKLKNTNIGKLFNNALAKAGVANPEEKWKN